jgi:hypothetical protein
VEDEYAVWDQWFPAEHRALVYEGLSRLAAEVLARENQVECVRVDDWDDPRRPMLTLDLRPSRLNLLVRGGAVARAGWG